MASSAKGFPTKEFFVEILTRDIELNDAILDLLDNCIDGVIRLKNGVARDDNFYSSFCADIKINKDFFSIKDNCGGIPRKTAEEYAFRMGRVPTTITNQPTIGIYGIGMKRAIFKIGKEAIVHTKNNHEKYSVIIPESWATNADDWEFPINDNSENNTLDENGTEVIVTTLNHNIESLWSNEDKIIVFIERLKKAIQESYSLIIQKGFKITINGENVIANPVGLLVQKNTDKTGLRPFLFTSQYGSVSVKLAIGFYAPMASDDEIDEMNESERKSSEAGITVVCNDRIVIYNDKSNLTGWGTNGVPNYHTQFIRIKGIVVFESNNPSELPMTTTKRGIDHSSSIYIAVKDKICEGLKMFTNYTNRWKGRNTSERSYSSVAEKVDYSELFSETAKNNYGMQLRSDIRSGGETFRPSLPQPSNDKPYKIIRYSKSIQDIRTLVGFFYGDEEEDVSPSSIGEKCFDKVLGEAKGEV